MPRLTGLALLMVLTAASLLASGGQALATHVQCGDLITQDTTLDSNLVDCPGDGIVIGADHVTLDLNGHVVDGDGDPRGSQGCDTGIVNGRRHSCHGYPDEDGHDGVTVSDGVVRQFAFGVRALWADAIELLRLRVSGTSLGGISLGGVANGLIKGNRAVQSGSIGISLDSASGPNAIVDNVTARHEYGIHINDARQPTRVERNTVFDNSDGIRVGGASFVELRANRVFDNFADGMDVSDGVSDNVIEDNRVWGNGISGIWMGEGAYTNRVERNTVARNALAPYATPQFFPGGITLFGGRDNLMTGNNVLENGGLGGMVLGESTRRNVLEGNRVAGNRADGILLMGAFDEANVVLANTATENGRDGIRVGPDFTGPEAAPRKVEIRGNRTDGNGDDGIGIESSQTTVTANRAQKNFDFGIEAVPGVTDGGGNRAFGNGNQLQCLNVLCR